MTRLPVLIALIFVWSLPAWGERPRPLGWAIEAAERGNWDEAARIAARDGAVSRDVIEWMRLRAGEGQYRDVVAFLDRRPDWPGEALLRRRSEPAVIEQSDARVLAFFAETPPQTPQGVLAYARALSQTGQADVAERRIITAWRSMDMNANDHALFLARHGPLLSDHHVVRLDRMLWDGEHSAARRMFDLVGAGHVTLAEARIALQRNENGVDARIAAVPDALQDDPGLARDRLGWRVRKGLWDTAKELLRERSRAAESLGLPEEWGRIRRPLARDEMRDGDPYVAYELASRHYLSQGANYADLEWLSGYIALRYLRDPELALTHFQNHAAAVQTPISLGRAGYWIGRTWEALGDAQRAQLSYEAGASFQTSFYGLLAAERAGVPSDPELTGNETFGDWRTSSLVQRDLFEAGLSLLASGQTNLAERFWTHMAETLTRADAGLLGQAAIDLGNPHIAVMIGKRVAQRGITLSAPHYALHPLANADLPMAPEMSLAIARRESEFDPSVQSGAGARGLMQIMPRTGQELANRLDVTNHSTARLSTDPAYNARLGAAYLAELAGRFDGNVVLVSAAYNAGPSRPPRWINLFGDPRRMPGDFDVVDWIEHIPFRETRNYVMRVTESLPVYRARLGLPAHPVPFSAELVGSTLLPFAPQGE